MRSIFYSSLALVGMSKLDFSSISDSWIRFERYAEKFNKTYSSDSESKHRFMAFLENEEEIAELNALEGNAVFGWTKFTDLTKDEFSERLNFVPYGRDRRTQLFGEVPVQKPEKKLTATSLDWRTMNAVTAVKDQGDCGSCWAFSAVQSIESAYLLRHNETDAGSFLLSEQEVVSCDSSDGGCYGGDLPSAFDYIQSAGGLATESDYPYTSGDDGENGRCKSFTPMSGTTPKSYRYATPGCDDSCKNQDEDTLASNMQVVGPVGICVNAEQWQNYYKGVMSRQQCGRRRYRDLDHCVQLVGFSTIDANGYWIVKNSWAADWGENGYIYLEYGENTCGVADEALFVTL